MCQQTVHVIVAKLLAGFLLMKAMKLQDQRERAAIHSVYRTWQLRLERYHGHLQLSDDLSEDS